VGAGASYYAAQSLATRVVMRQHGFEWHDHGRPLKLRYADVRSATLVHDRRNTRIVDTYLEIELVGGAWHTISHVRGLANLQAAIARARRSG
jgi:hypothetical protein